jgi:S1-C subfamily serine protease
VPKPASEEELVKVALESSCEVRTSSSTGSTTARGSGALVSLDGLVLTCAHVLVGPRVTVRFVEGSLKGEYEAEVVRVNDRTDVALLRAKGVRAKSCLAIGTVEVERGAVVLAIGNPSVGEGAVAQAAMTRGAIVTPLGEDWGQPRVVADVAVASGSSGGPLIDVKQRCIVGVIAAISAPQFSEGQSSTGSFCLVAPATHLAEWLGIRVVE